MSNLFWSTDQSIGVAWALTVLASGAGVRVADALSTRLRRPWLVTAVFVAGYAAVDRALHLAVDLAWERAHARAFGRAVPSLGAAASGHLASGLTVVAGCVLSALALRALAIHAPRRGWMAMGSAMTAVAAVILVAQPAFEPGAPLGGGPTEEVIVDVARQAGVPRDWLRAQPCSAADACDPAHVVGVGPTRRVLIDTTQLDALPVAWARQTMAHEPTT